MHVPAVLVIGTREDKSLNDLLLENGLTPVFRKSILDAITALRKDRFLAAIVNNEGQKLDVLESVLNIRDVNERLPVFVLGEKNSSVSDGVAERERLSVVTRTELLQRLAPPPTAGS